MPDDERLPARVTNQDLQTMDFADALDAYTPNLADALPDHIPLQRFKRVVVTAVNMTPELRHADRRSLFNACVKCAHDGLYPDGREAALVVFNSKEKRKNERGMDVEAYVKKVQYLPMIAGIRKRMRNTGELLSATAEVVYRNDHFRYVKGEEPRIEHEPCALDQERGDPVGAYAIIRLANGEIIREVMGFHEIERVRAFGRNAKSPGGPWMTSWGEMARKTVLRRCAKSAPTGSDLDRILARDDEEPEDASPAAQILPRPLRSRYINHVPETGPDEGAATVEMGDGEPPVAGGSADVDEDPELGSRDEATLQEPPTWTVTFPEGELREFDTLAGAEESLSLLLNASRSRGELEAVWEDNRALVAESPNIKRFDRLVHDLREGLELPSAEPAQVGPPAEPASSRPARPQQAPQRRAAVTPVTPSPSPESPAVARGGDRAPNASAGVTPEPARVKIAVPPGKDGPNYRLWAVVSFMNAARKVTDFNELAYLVGDHEKEIDAYKFAYPGDAVRFQKDLEKLFNKLEERRDV